jgi:hypothetical protein
MANRKVPNLPAAASAGSRGTSRMGGAGSDGSRGSSNASATGMANRATPTTGKPAVRAGNSLTRKAAARKKTVNALPVRGGRATGRPAGRGRAY